MYRVSNLLSSDPEFFDSYPSICQVAERINKELEPCFEMFWIDWQGRSHPILHTSQVLELLEFHKEVTLRVIRAESSTIFYIKKDGIY